MIGRGAWSRVRLSSLSSAMVGSMAPHPLGEPGWSGGLGRDLGEDKATEL
jgi:hypothetical protein